MSLPAEADLFLNYCMALYHSQARRHVINVNPILPYCTHSDQTLGARGYTLCMLAIIHVFCRQLTFFSNNLEKSSRNTIRVSKSWSRLGSNLKLFEKRLSVSKREFCVALYNNSFDFNFFSFIF